MQYVQILLSWDLSQFRVLHLKRKFNVKVLIIALFLSLIRFVTF
jgi:hypothetical protein